MFTNKLNLIHDSVSACICVCMYACCVYGCMYAGI